MQVEGDELKKKNTEWAWVETSRPEVEICFKKKTRWKRRPDKFLSHWFYNFPRLLNFLMTLFQANNVFELGLHSLTMNQPTSLYQTLFFKK